MKRYIINICKILLALGLVVWLLKQDKIDFSLLDSYLTPELGFVTIVFWILTPVLLAGLRWHLILRYVLKMNISLSDSIRIHCTSLFFNGFLPGAVGGDAVKVMFGKKVLPDSQVKQWVTSCIIDRLMGLITLIPFSLGLVGSLATAQVEGTTFQALWTAIVANVGIVGLLIGLWLYLGGKYPVKAFLIPMAVSAAVHLLTMIYFHQVAIIGAMSSISLTGVLSIYPLGGLMIALPLTPGGMGVGHIVFEQLFAIVGAQGGANAYNIFSIGQIALNGLGMLALFVKTKASGQDINASQLKPAL